VSIWLASDKYDLDSLHKVSDLTQASLGLLFHRVNHAFIVRFEVIVAHTEDARFLGFLRDQADALECRTGILSVTHFLDPRGHTDYALVDFVAGRLKPQTLHASIVSGPPSPCGTLLDRMSMRRTLKHVHLHVSQERSVQNAGTQAQQLGRVVYRP
jgi:hypothetical protein